MPIHQEGRLPVLSIEPTHVKAYHQPYLAPFFTDSFSPVHKRVLSTQAWCPHHERSPLIICSSDLTTTRTLTCRGLGPKGGRLFEKTDDISTGSLAPAP
ncbi:UNVERIFIED_CONTAM: hypothetical protein FKN15_070939 [Acipenser sinensis]